MKKKFPSVNHPRLLRQLSVLLVVVVGLSNVAWAASWSATGSLNSPRQAHTATLLTDGRVLIVGGLDTASLKSTELFDPATGTFTPTGDLNTARDSHTATLLADGRVLVAGGTDNNFSLNKFDLLQSAELFDPATGMWTTTGNLNTAREVHLATRLADGRVLVAGGVDDALVPLKSAELFDPATGMWTVTGDLNTALALATMTRLADGRALAAGGVEQFGLGGTNRTASAELFDPATGMWTATGNLNTARDSHTATHLGDGRVLVAGGAGFGPLQSAELFNPATGMWTATGNLNTARTAHTATKLKNGWVLVAGGFTNSAELFDPTTGAFTVTAELSIARTGHTATLLENSQVLVTGGFDCVDLILDSLNSAELFDPDGINEAAIITIINTLLLD
jgi:N-acetylneuraminic acid mutarotase